MDKMMQEELLIRWYEAIKNFNKKEADQYKKFFESIPNFFTNEKVRRLHQLFEARYLILYAQYEQASAKLSEMKFCENESDYRLKYFYYFFQGILLYRLKNYVKAIEHMKAAEPIVKTVGSLIELAEFQYQLACVYNRTYHYILSNDYIEQALGIFQDSHYHLRTTHCEIVIALNFVSMKQYNEAETYLQRSLLHSAKVKDERVKMIVLHNFGFFYAMVNQPKVALNYLSQALELIQSDYDYAKVQNLFLSAECFYKTEQMEMARRTLLRAEALAHQANQEDYINLCKMAQAKYIHQGDLKQTYEKGIGFFNANKRWHLVLKYSKELAAVYQNEKAYEKACQYYALALEAQKQIEEAQMQSL